MSQGYAVPSREVWDSMDPRQDSPQWDRCYGNNHHRFLLPDVACGGSVSFARHLGHPLSQELWVDLRFRLGMTGLCIYRPDSPQWTIGWGGGHCCIDLDENDNVCDIRFVPHSFFTRRPTAEPEHGGSIGYAYQKLPGAGVQPAEPNNLIVVPAVGETLAELRKAKEPGNSWGSYR